ncbi:di-trans,poly-cis-decaprenylcistransferase [Halteromyces radiatus]|uniref:di-trans,poly-cis-decaprenylcistransferase n=1 Tax=Halteromyces radiatus TaxID=101107 RepID=UPI00221FC816|nr:di-trans,poly-cis-decaprenylcistransferase [Halteromyces radiatus]KAI8092710.1 di-trans,poly-cis-decaprenylcistransferase [Halteromyces radiatus]
MSLSRQSSTILAHYFDYGMSCLEQAAIAILTKGRIPKHLGFILDGNRRFARKMGASSTRFGHYEGLKRLEKVLELCMQLGVLEITVFAFSIENFKRSQEEVEYLMQLFRETFMDFCNNNKFIKDNDIRVQFLGNLDYLPKDVADLAKQVIDQTRNNRGRTFNICCPYTSRDEMTTSIKKNIQLIEEEKLKLEDINQETIEQQLFTSTSYPLDILVRTSGEIRLSDFLLYQASQGCQVHFIDCYWPEFSLWKFLPILLEYQIYYDYMRK